ncbi:MAG: tyrosine-type recombinase/integrase [Campylobacterota bacterium]|nr:tyrosine-type recombinase/integrase [Campylobacterota bacterium]
MAIYKIKDTAGKGYISHVKYIGHDDIDLDQIANSSFKKNVLVKITGYTLKHPFRLQVEGEAKANGARKRIKRIIDFAAKTTMKKAIESAKHQYVEFVEEEKENLRKDLTSSMMRISNEFNEHSTFETAFELYLKAKITSYKSINKKIPTVKLNGEDTLFGSEIRFKNKHLISLLDMPINKIKKIHLEQIMANMINKDGSPLATRTKRGVFELVRQVYSYIIDSEDIVVKNPGTLKGYPKLDNRRDVKVPLKNAKALYNSLYNYHHPIYATIFTFLLYGRRLDEVLTLTWEVVDIENKTYTILAEHNKPRIDMEYVLPDRLINKLKKIGIKKKGIVFPSINNDSKMMSPGTLRDHWLKLREVIDSFKLNKRMVSSKHFRMHDIRHIIGGHLVNKGISRDVIGVVLGHTQDGGDDITARYAQIDYTTAHDAIEGMIKEFII